MTMNSKTARMAAVALVLGVMLGALVAVNGQQAVPGATPVQQVQPFTTCNQTATATSAGNGAATITLTPPSGQYVYICSIYISEAINATVSGAAGPAPIETTGGLQNNLVWWGDNSSLAQGVFVKIVDDQFPLFLKTNAAGTAFTITNSAGQATQNVRINVTAFFAP
jgi:hypothetical protein